MKASQKIALEMSTKREALNALLGEDELSDDQRSEMGTLTERMQQLEVEARAAILAEGDPTITRTDVSDGEGRELRSLIDRASVGMIFEAALEHRATDGAEAELQAHYRLAANSIPLVMLETRAVTPAPSDAGQNQAAIIPGVFPQSCAAFMGVDMPTVPTGRSDLSGSFHERDSRNACRECVASRNHRQLHGGGAFPVAPASFFFLLQRGPCTFCGYG